MKILGIETSCDETALAIVERSGTPEDPAFTVLAEAVMSQIETHRKYGGVFPMLAKREHARNLIPLFKSLLSQAGMEHRASTDTRKHSHILQNIRMFFEREPELLHAFLEYIPTVERPPIDAVAVTQGPGLEPALWVGINFARALASVWDLPLIPANHMEGHLLSVLLAPGVTAKSIKFPIVALLVSGGHTELILADAWLSYRLLGQTRDDAVGEAFDKVARILGLPYPGGPQISALADEARRKRLPQVLSLPRPMIASGNYDFSFSGLKTAVLYGVQKLGKLLADQKSAVAREFEDAAVEVLTEKTRRAVLSHGAQTMILGGGVAANRSLRSSLAEMAEQSNITLLVPPPKLATDNAVMIALAALEHFARGERGLAPGEVETLAASGTMPLASH